MNFSSFTKQTPLKNQEKTTDDIVKEYNKLKDLGSDELTTMLFNEVNKQKSDGTFNYESLIASIESIKEMIPQNTYENLKKLVESLK